MRRCILITVILLVGSTPAVGQRTFKISVQTNYTPSYRLNYDRYTGATSITFKLSASNLRAYPVAIGVYISPAYHPEASVSYGASLAYVFTANKDFLFKAGINAGRLKMAESSYHVEVGSVLADDFHTILQPFIELEWLFSDYFSIYLQTSYRLLQSETSRVTKILKRSNRGLPMAYKTTANLGWYGSGVQFSVGLSISFPF